jgi:hypothetical protein
MLNGQNIRKFNRCSKACTAFVRTHSSFGDEVLEQLKIGLALKAEIITCSKEISDAV